MSERVTATGIVATEPRHLTTGEGLPITSFRLATDRRRYDRERGRWESVETNWFTVSSFRGLARNLARSVHKGDRLVVSGRLRVREWSDGDRGGVTVEIDADAAGHDLTWGTSRFVRGDGVRGAPTSSGVPAPQPERSDAP